jgi:isoleucyl-tRNA synthetase
VERVTDSLDAYEPTSAGRAIQAFVEDLSNWYVRRSRRRFWKSESDADKQAAYQTLYECLVTLAKLLAPFTPFVAEEMYQNLVRSADGAAPESVHLAEWPRADSSLVDQSLMDETRLIMRVVSLGRAARSKAGIKVRQPLSRVVVKPRYAAEGEGLKRLEAQLLEELNARALSVAEDEPELEGLAVARDDAGYAVGLDTAITPELADEGLARELVHRIQGLRKAAGFEISDHIVTYYEGGERLRQVLARHGDYVRQETLSHELAEGTPPPEAHAEEQKIDGEMVALAVRRSGG